MLTTYLLGIGSAVCFGVAAVIQQRVAFHAPPEDVLRLRLLLWLVRRPLWDVGVLLSAVGTFASAAALARSTVAFVAPLQVCQLLFALPLAAVWARRRAPRRDWAAAAATALGLATFLVAGDPQPGEVEAATTLGWALTCLSIGGLAAWAVLGTRRLNPVRRATLLAAGAGLLSALQGALIGSVGRLVETSGVGAIAACWQTYAVVVVALTSGLLLQSAYEMAPLPASLPAAVSLEPLGGVAIGVFLLGGMLRVSPLAVAGQIIGLAIMVAGVRALGTSPLVTGQMSRLHARTSQGQLSKLEDLLHRDLEVLRDDLLRGRRASTDRSQRRQYRRLHHDLDRIHCELARLVDDRDRLDARIRTLPQPDPVAVAGAAPGTSAGRPPTSPSASAAASGSGVVAGRGDPSVLDSTGDGEHASASGASTGPAVGAGLRRLATRIRFRTNTSVGGDPTHAAIDSSAAHGVQHGTPIDTHNDRQNGTRPVGSRPRRATAGRPSARVPRAPVPGSGPAPRSGSTAGARVPGGFAVSETAPPPNGRALARASRRHTPPTAGPTSGGSTAGPAGRETRHPTGPPAEPPPDVVSDNELITSQQALDARADALLAQAEDLSARAEQLLRSLAH